MTGNGQPQGIEAPKKKDPEVITGRYQSAVEIMSFNGNVVSTLLADPSTGKNSTGVRITETVKDMCRPGGYTFRWIDSYRTTARGVGLEMIEHHPDTYVARMDNATRPENRFPTMIG